jgi:hypothetical protein
MGSVPPEAAKRIDNHEQQAANLHCHWLIIGMGESPSVIDDILLRPPIGVSSTESVHAAEIHQVHGYNTDHALITASFPVRCQA